MRTCNFCKKEINNDYTRDVARIEIVKFNNQGKNIKGVITGKVDNYGIMGACEDCMTKITGCFDRLLSDSSYATFTDKCFGWRP